MSKNGLVLGIIFPALFSLPVYAGDTVTVGIYDFSPEGVSGEHLERFQSGLVRRLQGEKVKVLAGEEALNDIRGTTASPGTIREIADARAFLARGKESYENLKFDKALQDLTHASQILEKHIPDLEGLSLLEEVHLYAAMAYQAGGEEQKSRDELFRVASLNPGKKLDEALYPPSLVSSFEQARAAVASSTTTLFVETQPPLAFVYLDGRKKGASPLTINDVPPGVHQLSTEKLGFSKKAMAVEAGSTSITMTLKSLEGSRSLEAIRNVLRGGKRPDESAEQVGRNIPALARSLEADYVILTALRPMVEAYQADILLFDGRDGRLLHKGDFPLSPDPEEMDEGVKKAVQALLPLIQAPRAEGWDVSREFAPPKVRTRAWYASWKVWASVGGACLLASGASFYMAQAAAQNYGRQVDAYNQYVTTSNPPEASVLKSSRDKAEGYKAQFTTDRTWGFVTLGASALFFGSAAWLGLSSAGTAPASSLSFALLPLDDGAHLALSVPF